MAKRQQYYQDKSVLITGGASGIGFALAQRLATYGAKLYLADIQVEKLAQAAAQLNCAQSMLDVRDAEQFESVIRAVKTEFGHVDFVFNNAGIEISGEAKDLTAQHWQDCIDINLMGVVNGTRLAYQCMLKQGHGHIVNVASGAGLIMFPTSIPYTTAKAGVIGLTRSLAAEAEDFGIKVILVNPGMVKTEIFESAISIGPKIQEFAKQLPGRMLNVDDAANIILNGIAVEKSEITFPVENILGAWLVNVFPKFGHNIRKNIVHKFRKAKTT